MHHVWTLASFLFFTGLVGCGTWLLTRKDRHDTSTGYFLAGRTLGFGYIAGSLLLTNLSTEQLVGLNGAAFRDGLCVMAWEVIAAMSLVVMALFFLPRYLKSGVATVPQFLEERFGPTTRAITSLIFIIAYAGILLPIILYTGATGLNGILNIQDLTGIPSRTGALWFTVWFIGIVGSIYAIVGGLRTVAVSDTLNGFGLLVGGVAVTWLGLAALNPDAPLAALATLREQRPEHFNSLGGPNSSVPFSTLFTGVVLLNLFYWCTNQQIIQRTFGAPSLQEGQKGVLLAGLFKVLTPIILVLPGIIAFQLAPRIGLDRDRVMANDGTYAMTADNAYGLLVQHVLPSWAAGFFAAVVVGAILSSFNSALNSTATLFSLGVYKHMVRPDTDDRQVIRAGKVFGWAVAVLAMTVAPLLMDQTSIFGYLQKMNGLYFIPIFSVVLVGLLARRVPPVAANVALVGGFLVIALGYFVVLPLAGLTSPLAEFHFLGGVFALLVVTMLAVGAARPTPEPWTQRSSGDVDLTSWKFAWPAGLALVLFVLGVYVYFGDLRAVGIDW